MNTNEVQMCRELFHFLIILTASESDQTHARFTTESGESDHIPPRQNLGFSRSGSVIRVWSGGVTGERSSWIFEGRRKR